MVSPMQGAKRVADSAKRGRGLVAPADVAIKQPLLSACRRHTAPAAPEQAATKAPDGEVEPLEAGTRKSSLDVGSAASKVAAGDSPCCKVACCKGRKSEVSPVIKIKAAATDPGRARSARRDRDNFGVP